MKDTRIRILLGVVLLGVWGVVIYRFLARLNGPDQTAVQVSTQVAPPAADFEYRLDSLAGNPFGVGQSRKRRPAPVAAGSGPAQPRTTAPGRPPQPPTPFPDISYVGFVDPAGGQPTALIRYQGQLLRLQPGQEVAGASLKSASAERCTLRFAEADSVLLRSSGVPVVVEEPQLSGN